MSYEAFIRDYIDRSEPHTDTATDAARDLLAEARAGEPWALTKLFDLARASLVREIKERRAAAHVITYIDGNGKKRRMNAAVSQPVYDEKSGEVAHYNLVIEWDMDARQLNRLMAQLQNAATEVAERRSAVRALLDALAAHPECATARDAWLAEGRSLDEIDLSA